MAYSLSQFKSRAVEVEAWLSREQSGIRTGRATPAILDGVAVESYGSRQPLKAVAAVSIEDAKTLRVSPWDKTQIKAIETALAAANLGLSSATDAAGIRVIFPDLTAERGQMLIKVVKEKLEESRVSLRKEREKMWNEIVDEEKAGKLSEDDKFRGKDDLQELVDECKAKLEAIADKKEQELLS